jgi:hypothetical protein
MFYFFFCNEGVVHFDLFSAESDEVDAAVVVFRQSVKFTKFVIAMFAINTVNACFLITLSATTDHLDILAG